MRSKFQLCQVGSSPLPFPHMASFILSHPRLRKEINVPSFWPSTGPLLRNPPNGFAPSTPRRCRQSRNALPCSTPIGMPPPMAPSSTLGTRNPMVHRTEQCRAASRGRTNRNASDASRLEACKVAATWQSFATANMAQVYDAKI